MHDPLATAKSERLHLQRQVMIGYALYLPDHPWDGTLYQRLARAQDALDDRSPTTEVVLVHQTGTLYYQSAGNAHGRVVSPNGATVHLPVRRAQRAVRHQLRRESERRKAARRPAPPPSMGKLRGFTHTPYLD